MKTLGSALIVATMMGAPAAYAQQMDSTSSNQVTVMAIAQPQTLGPSEQKVTYDGHTWTTPSAQGSYFGGANPCLIGTGGGAAGGPVAFNINIGRSDEGCQRRSDAAAWHAMGFDNVAIARMCQDIKSADAFFAATGQACPGAASGRYKLADGSAAPRASLVANSRAIPSNPYAGPVDLNNPAVQAAIRAEAQRLVRGTSTITGASATPRSPQSVSPRSASVGQ
jgi:hypothetical protein